MTQRSWSIVLTAAAVAAAVAISIGPPLVGIGIFAGVDLLEEFDPWTTAPPDLEEIDNPLLSDLVNVALPARKEISARLADGDFPSWQSEVNGGRPLGTVPNTASFSPLNASFLLLPMEVAPVVAKLLELGVAFAGTILLLRRWGARPEVGVLTGLLVAYTGFEVAWTGWPQAHIAALFPGLLWATDLAVTGTRRALHALPLAALVLIASLEGFPVLTIVGLGLAGIYAIVRVWGRTTRAAAGDLTRAAGGVALGLGLAAAQLVPFAYFLRGLELPGRVQTAADTLPTGTLLTTVLPTAFGTPAVGWAPRNFNEIQAFVGVVALVLVGVGLWRGRPRWMPRGIVALLWTAVVVSLVLVYAGGPLLAAAQTTPLLATNDVGRLRVVLLLGLVLLAGVTLEDVLRNPSRPADRWSWVRSGAGLLVVGVVVALGARPAWVGATTNGMGDELLASVAWVLVAGTLALGAIVAARRWRRALVALVPLLAVIAGVDAVRVTLPVWPDAPEEALYPATDSHEFLVAHQGWDRTASGLLAIYPGTTTWYGIRTAAGHAFPETRWRQALEIADPDVYTRLSDTLPVLAPTLQTATSPALDYLGVRWFVNGVDVPILGEDVPAAETGDRLGADPLEVELPRRGRVRGVTLELTSPLVPQPVGEVEIELLDGDRVVSSATRRVPRASEDILRLPVPEAVATDARITWTGPPVELADRPATVTYATDDGLELEHASGVTAYERTRFLPRYRWATTARVVADVGDRLAALATAPSSGEVILDTPRSLPAPAGEAELEVLAGDDDFRRILVDAEGAGWLVVSDSLQDGWVARIDGREADLVAADHVGVAVAVPPGRHEVTIRHVPPGFRTGLIVSLVSAMAVVAVAVLSLRRQNRRASSR